VTALCALRVTQNVSSVLRPLRSGQTLEAIVIDMLEAMVVASTVPKEVMPPSAVLITTDLKVASADRVAPPMDRLIGAEMSMSAWSGGAWTRSPATTGG
jgi:hypothetical protein